VASKSNSSSKGLAGFAALVNKANLSAAKTETSRGLRSSSSSKFQGVGATSREEKTEDIFTVGMIVFLVVGVTENISELDPGRHSRCSRFSPCLLSSLRG
jgi:hypothetical protein